MTCGEGHALFWKTEGGCLTKKKGVFGRRGTAQTLLCCARLKDKVRVIPRASREQSRAMILLSSEHSRRALGSSWPPMHLSGCSAFLSKSTHMDPGTWARDRCVACLRA